MGPRRRRRRRRRSRSRRPSRPSRSPPPGTRRRPRPRPPPTRRPPPPSRTPNRARAAGARLRLFCDTFHSAAAAGGDAVNPSPRRRTSLHLAPLSLRKSLGYRPSPAPRSPRVAAVSRAESRGVGRGPAAAAAVVAELAGGPLSSARRCCFTNISEAGRAATGRVREASLWSVGNAGPDPHATRPGSPHPGSLDPASRRRTASPPRSRRYNASESL